MLNFNCLNKALLDENLNDNEFRTLYLIANSIALSGEDEITMYNEYIAEKLHITVREVRYRTSSLVKKGYIIKTPTRIGNKKPNKIKLTEQMFLDSDKSEGTNTSKVKEQTFPLYNSTEEKNTMNNEKENKITREEITKRNDYITNLYNQLQSKLDNMYATKDRYTYNNICNDVLHLVTDSQEKQSWFTDRQWDKVTKFVERWVKITEIKDNYFNTVQQNAFEEGMWG